MWHFRVIDKRPRNATTTLMTPNDIDRHREHDTCTVYIIQKLQRCIAGTLSTKSVSLSVRPSPSVCPP